jgi:general secretion pathway protein D
MMTPSSRLVIQCLVATVCLAGITGCATTGFAHRGRQAEQAGDFDQAVAAYTKAIQQKPGDRTSRQALQRARLRAAQHHYTQGGRYAYAGKLDQALVEYQLAAELNPVGKEIEEAVRATRIQLRTRVAVARGGQTRLETLVERSQSLSPPGMDLPTDIKLPASLVFRDARASDVFSAIAHFADISLVFDEEFRDQPVTIDLRNAGLEDALAAASRSTKSFYRVTGLRTVTVIPDTTAKRREYEEEIVRTFYLSNADLKETINVLRIVIDARRIAPITANNAIVIKDTPERVAAAAKLITAIDKARPEVVIDVELLEVDRTQLRDYGLQIASPGSQGLNGGASLDGSNLTLRNLRNLSQSDIMLTSLPGLFYRLLKTDSNTRTLANPQLRTSEGIPAQARFGERVPVPVTQFAPLATGGTAQQPITSFNYENIGVNIDITPRTHHNDEVTLAIKVAVSSISGTGFGGLPTFGNREINTVIRLRDGETNMLAGLIRDDERRVLDGIPWLSDLPLIGRLFARSRKETQETDIVLTLTPRIIRVLNLSDADLRPFRVDRNTVSSAIDSPRRIPLPPPVAPAPAGLTPAAPVLPPTLAPAPSR